MSLTIGELTGFIDLDDSKFNQGLDDSGRRFEGFGTRLAGLAKKAAMAGGAAIAGLAVAGVKEFATLERGMNEVFTLLPHATGDAMGQMTDDVRAFSREMGILPNEVVPALYSSLSAGVPEDTVFDFLETANQAAIGGVTDLETAVDGISSVVNAYGDDVIDATQASDLMFTAVRLGKTDFEQLSGSLFNVLPTASALGVGFGDITAAMAEMTAQGVPTSVATTQMRQLLVELSKDGSQASEAFKELAGVGLKEFMDQGGNMADALDIMQQAADDNGVALQDMFGSVEAGAAALALASGGTDAYRVALDEMNDSAGATAQAHETMDQGLSRTWERIKANVMVTLGEIGETIAPSIGDLGDTFVDWMPRIADATVSTFETLVEAVGWGVDAFGWLQDNVGPVVSWLGDRLGEVTDWFGLTRSTVGDELAAMSSEAVGEMVDMAQGMIDQVTILAHEGGELTGDMRRDWVANIEHMRDETIAAAEETYSDTLAAIVGLSLDLDSVSDEMRDSMIANAREQRDGTIATAEEQAARVEFILWNAARTGEEITREQAEQIVAAMEDQRDGVVLALTDQEAEVGVIMARLAEESGQISREAASNAIATSWEQTQETVAAAEEAFEETVRIVTQQARDNEEITSEMADEMISEARRNRDQSIAAALGLHHGVVSEVEDMRSTVGSEMNLMTGHITSGFEATFLPMAMWAYEWEITISRWAINMWQGTVRVVTFFRSLPGRIVEALGNLASDLYSIGWNAVDGLKRGVEARAKAAVDAITSTARAMAGAAVRTLGIGSPSRVFRDIGQHTVEGLTLGMHDMIGDVVREAEAIARAAVPDIAAGELAGVGASLGTAAPGGGDRQVVDLLRRIARELEDTHHDTTSGTDRLVSAVDGLVVR